MPKYRVMCYRQGVWDGQEARIIEERVEFLDYFRFMMRAIANPYPRITSESDQQLAQVIRDMYGRKGSQVGLAEQLLYYEDWVGTDNQ
jgi:hypothetical protein